MSCTPSKDMPKGIQWFKHFPVNFINLEKIIGLFMTKRYESLMKKIQPLSESLKPLGKVQELGWRNCMS